MKWIAMIMTMVLACAVLGGCTSVSERDRNFEQTLEASHVGLVLKLWHSAASNGSFESYFDRMTEDAVFLGTDETERWTKAEFMGYAREPFGDGHGWTYVSRGPEIAFSDDRQTAWIDEVLDHEKYGVLRGTGVLVRDGDEWKIAQYSLTFLVPNEKASMVVEAIRGED